MERIVTQTIPAVVVDNPGVDWNPFTNEVKPAAVADGTVRADSAGAPSAAPEPDTRYAMLLETFRAARLVDPFSPTRRPSSRAASTRCARSRKRACGRCSSRC